MCCECSSFLDQSVSRRRFVKKVALGGGAMLLSTMLPGIARASGNTEALLLSCMDYRLVDDTEKYMAGRGLRNKYDHVVLAGASLGAVTTKFPEWGKTFWGHLDVAINLHHIKKVVVIDHRDCGAYKVILGEDLATDKPKEFDVHAAQLKKFKAQILKKHPKLEVELALMDLEGKVEEVKEGKTC